MILNLIEVNSKMHFENLIQPFCCIYLALNSMIKNKCIASYKPYWKSKNGSVRLPLALNQHQSSTTLALNQHYISIFPPLITISTLSTVCFDCTFSSQESKHGRHAPRKREECIIKGEFFSSSPRYLKTPVSVDN